MVWTTPRDWTVGEGLTAAKFDTYISDNLAALLPVDQVAWKSWTPSLTNLTLGSGTVVAKYTQLGNLVQFRFSFTLGSGSAVGTGPVISLPVTAATEVAATRHAIGEVLLIDTGTADYSGLALLATTTTCSLWRWAVTGANVIRGTITATAPFTWTTGSVLTVTGAYEAA